MRIDLKALQTLSFSSGVFMGNGNAERKETIEDHKSYQNTLTLRSMSID